MDEVLEHEAGLRRMAMSLMLRSRPDFDDVLQEGMIAFWRSLTDTDGQVALAYHAARLRMRKMLSTSHSRTVQPTGHEPLPGHVAVTTVAVLDRPIGDDGGGTLAELLLGGQEALEGVEMAYHHGQIAAALNALRPDDRAYVVRRFWEGYTDSEIAREQGVGTSTIHNRWVRRIRPRLLEALDHLAA